MPSVIIAGYKFNKLIPGLGLIPPVSFQSFISLVTDLMDQRRESNRSLRKKMEKMLPLNSQNKLCKENVSHTSCLRDLV